MRGTADIELQTLTRIMKILERSIRQGELVDPFGSSTKEEKSSEALDEEKTSKGLTNNSQDIALQKDSTEMSVEVLEQLLNRLETQLEIARDSVAAADCCIALLASDRLPKQVNNIH